MSQNVLGANSWPVVGLTRYYPAAVGRTHTADTLSVGTRTTGQALDNLVAAPLYTGLKGLTISQWSVTVSTAGAGALYRIGVWRILNQSDPFAWTAGAKYARLLRDVGAAVGTIDCATTGSNGVTDSYTLPANTWVMVGGVMQGAAANLLIGTNLSGYYSPYGLFASGAGLNAGSLVGLAQSGVTGALGDLTPSGGSAVGHGVAFHRSA